MLFQVLTIVDSLALPAVAATATMLFVCAVENALAISVGLNVLGVKPAGLNVLGENVLGLNVLGLNVEGLNVLGENVLGLNVEGLNTLGLNVLGLNVDGAYASGLNVLGLNVLGLNVDGATSAARRTSSCVVAVAGSNCFANALPMSLKTARS